MSACPAMQQLKNVCMKPSHTYLQEINPVPQAGSDGDTSSGGDAGDVAQGPEMEPDIAEVSVS